jgi:hypothetical protein
MTCRLFMRSSRETRGRRAMRGALVLAVAVISSSAARAQLILSIPTAIQAHPGDTITIPINLTVVGNQLDSAHGNGISGDAIAFSYNASLGSPGATNLGTLISNPSFNFQPYSNSNSPGLIRETVSSNLPGTPGLPSSTNGSLMLLMFSVSSSAAPGAYPLTLLDHIGATPVTSITDNGFNEYDAPPPITNTVLSLVSGSVTVTPVPEPGSMFLVGSVVAVIGVARRRPDRGDSAVK